MPAKSSQPSTAHEERAIPNADSRIDRILAPLQTNGVESAGVFECATQPQENERASETGGVGLDAEATPSDEDAIRTIAKALDIELPHELRRDDELRPRKSDSAAEGFRRVFADQWQRVCWNEPGARLGADPKFVHEMRVATRRLRTALRAAQDDVQAGLADRLRGDLKRLQDTLGAVRDCDIALQRFDRDTRRLSPPYDVALQPYRRTLDAQRGAAREGLNAYLDSGAYAALGAEITRLLGGGEVWLETSERAYKKVVRKRAKKLAERLREHASEVDHRSSDETLHALRIDAKRARYAFELLEPVMGKRVRKAIKRLKQLQDNLGAHHDAVVAHALAERAVQEFLQDEQAAPEIFVGFGQLMQIELNEAKARSETFFIAWDVSMQRYIKKCLNKAVTT